MGMCVIRRCACEKNESATVTKFLFLFLSMIVKNVYKEAAMQNFSVIFHIWPELYDDEVGGLHYDPPL